jgi:hypothetical protein
MSAPTTAQRSAASVIELEIASESGPGWLGSGAEPVTVSLTAESVRFEGAHLHFITGNTVVRSVPRSEVTALTWRGSPPRGRGKGPHRNSGVIWSEEERDQLAEEVLGDLSWIEISHRHERSVSAVRREAVRMRLVDELGRRLDEPPTPLAGAPATPSPLTAFDSGPGSSPGSGSASGPGSLTAKPLPNRPHQQPTPGRPTASPAASASPTSPSRPGGQSTL